MLSNDVSSPLVARLAGCYDELVAYVCRAAGRFQVDRHQARDTAREAVHDVCLQLLKDRQVGQEARVPLAFLRTLTKRRAIDNLRQETAWRRLASRMEDTPGALSQAADETCQPARQAAARQSLLRLAQAIEALPPRCRDVFILHKIHEWPQAEVARHLGISLKTVEKHLRIGVACCRMGLRDDDAA
ncbi:FIG006045: Sigma factor, ECF subfamily [plant metagenome]|uniref:FIG006045: Sigma factor, ECF subfamily n=1 Tax=plant metagenome TaxID=1297885 RepID=A0A484QU58_9ZZZZ